MGATYTTIYPLLQERLHKKNIEIFMSSGNPKLSPFISQLQMRNDIKEDFGRGYVIPISTSRGSAVSNDFTVAQGKAAGTTTGSAIASDRWVVTPTTKHAICRWDREAILACETNGAADRMYDAIVAEQNAKIGKLKHRLGITFMESGYGRVATITAAPTSTTITVSTSAVNRFEIGDDLVAAATETGALRSATSIRIDGIDPDTGVLTLSADPTGLSWANGDTLFFEGDHTSGSLTEPVGLRGYLPDSAPTATLFGVTRLNTPATAGRRLNCASYSDLLQSVFKAAERQSACGNFSDTVFVSTADFATMAYNKDQVKIVEINVGPLNIGFATAQVLTPHGTINMQTEMLMEQGRFYMGPFKEKDFAPFLAHTGDLVRIDDFSGSDLIPVYNAAQFEQRLFSRLGLCFPAPGKFIVGYGVPA